MKKSKMRNRKLKFSAFFLACLLSFSAFSQTQTTRILFVFDCSFSMYGKWQTGIKMDIAKSLLSSFMDSLKGTPNLEIALRCYGHQVPVQPKRDCEDTKLEVAFAPVDDNVPKIKNRLKSLEPTGTTPIAHTLGKCAADFTPKANCRNIIILITDGIEECDGDPCAVSLELQKKGIILKPFVIGIGLSSVFGDYMGCIGKYYDASSEMGFANVLNIVVSQALNNTTVQVNLLDQTGKPSETDVNMTFYDQYTGAIKYNYMHTINNKGNPDTIVLDPIGTYKMVVHTIPQVIKENITLIPGKHNIIAVSAPQGYLNLKISGANNYKFLNCIVRQKGQMKTLNVQNFGDKEKYITGNYDLEILTLPRILMPNINIAQSSTTTIEIPEAGYVTIAKPSPGPGSIYLEKDNMLVWVCNLDENNIQETLVLQPGNYRVEFRPQNSKESIYTVERKFIITSGQSTVVKLY